MASVEDLREALAALAVSSLQTNDAIRALAATVGAATGPAAAAGPAVLMTALQTVRKSSETTVQLSLSDTQFTVLESSGPTGLTTIDAIPETTQVQVDNKSDILLEFHRTRGFKVRDAQRTLPDGAWVNDTPDDVDDIFSRHHHSDR